MLYVSKKLNDFVYEVTDTDDEVVEMATYSDLMKYASKGIKILGVSDDLVYVFNNNKNPYLGIERHDMLKYSFIGMPIPTYRGRRLEVRFKFFKLKDTGKLEPVTHSQFRIMPNFDVHVVVKNYSTDSYEDLGLLAFLGEHTFPTSPDLTAYLGVAAEEEIHAISSDIAHRIQDNKSSQFEYDSEYDVYKSNSVCFNKNNLYNIFSAYHIYINDLSKDSFCLKPSENRLNLFRITGAYTNIALKHDSQVIIVSRVIKKSGIYYNTLNKGSTRLGQESLEDIYNTLKQWGNDKYYLNAWYEGNKMTIQALDGVFEYEMDIIYSIYKNFISEEGQHVLSKLKLTGVADGDLDINGKNELVRLNLTSENIKIPKNVVSINSRAIIITRNTKSVFFGSNIKKIDKNAVVTPWNDFEYSVKTDINDLKVLTELFIAVGKNENLNIITSKDDSNFVEIICAYAMIYELGSVFASRLQLKTVVDSDLACEILDMYILKGLNNFKWLEEPIKVSKSSIVPRSIESITAKNTGSYKKWMFKLDNLKYMLRLFKLNLDNDKYSYYLKLYNSCLDKIKLREESLRENISNYLQYSTFY